MSCLSLNRRSNGLTFIFLDKNLIFTPPIHMTGTPFSNCRMEYFRTDSLWSDNDLRRHRSSNRQPKRYCTYVSASCRTGCWTQQNFHYHSLSPRNWQKWNTYRICWRVGQKNSPCCPIEKSYLTSFCLFKRTNQFIITDAAIGKLLRCRLIRIRIKCVCSSCDNHNAMS